MYGNVVTNRQLRILLEKNSITIDPFEEKNLKSAAYTLTPGRIYTRGEDGEYDVSHTFGTRRKNFSLPPNEYIVIEAKEKVAIRENGIIGTFTTASTNIENGLLIVAGQIDSHYGVRGEALRFGVKNLLDCENQITSDTRLVHLQLVDMRGSATDPIRPSKAQRDHWSERVNQEWAENNIPNYGAADE
ncbi:MAG: hypothetical protein WAT93_00560 [Pontixanthobacter sp.]